MSKDPSVELTESIVQVWRADLDVEAGNCLDLASFLSPDEVARATRFKSLRDKDRFSTCRGLLRRLLSNYLGFSPAEIQFESNAFGKPAVSRTTTSVPLQFNVSHSRDKALLVFTMKNRVGVDIEFIRPDFATEAISRRFFSPGEADRLMALPAFKRAEAFFNCWTRKEAYIKANGMGMSIPLNSFEVAFEPDRDASLLRSNVSSEETQRWSIAGLDVGTDYAAALAVESVDFEVRVQTYSY